MSTISPVSGIQPAASLGVETQKPADNAGTLAALKVFIGQLQEQLGVGNKGQGQGPGGKQQAGAIPANETPAAQQKREALGHELARAEQQKREAEGHQKARQEQLEREGRGAQEHGTSPSGTHDDPYAGASSARRVPVAEISAMSADTANVERMDVKLASAKLGYSNVSGGLDTEGMVTKGTHPLRPVPQNGGELSEKPTTLGDINAIIKDIDPSLLTDPAQKGDGKLKDLPYGKMFEAAGKATGIDPVLLYADAQVETGDNLHSRVLVPNNINPIQTAPGVWPTTANAATNLFMGAFVMKDYINRADGDLKRGLNAYNTGNLDPSEKGFAHGYAGYYEGVMSAYANVQKAIKDPSIIEPGQGGNVSIESQI